MNFNKEKLKNGTSGRNTHRFLIKETYRMFSNMGYDIKIEHNFAEGTKFKADVFATKGDEKIVIECLTRPTIKVSKDKQKYKKYCDKLFVTYPSDFIPTFPLENFFDKVIEMEIPVELIVKNTKQKMQIEKTTARRIQIIKHSLGYSSADETINKLFDIVEKIQNAK